MDVYKDVGDDAQKLENFKYTKLFTLSLNLRILHISPFWTRLNFKFFSSNIPKSHPSTQPETTYSILID